MFKHFFASILQMIMFVLFTKICHFDILVDTIMKLFDPGISTFKDVIACTLMIFICLFGIIGTVFFFCLALYNLIMVFVRTFIIDNRMIHVAIDENNIIQDTFLELSDGKIIPIKITKLKMNNPKEENKIGE